jgi:hypothetical protein
MEPIAKWNGFLRLKKNRKQYSHLLKNGKLVFLVMVIINRIYAILILMELLIDINKSNIDEYLQKYCLIICKIRNSRIKAKQIALLEMIFAQYDNEITGIKNGPLGDISGIIPIFCRKNNLDSFKERLFGIGYCCKFYILDFENTSMENKTGLRSINPLIWKGKRFSIFDFFTQDNKIYEDHSPHNREFKIVGNYGEIKTIFGYRGDGSEFGRRSLPVEDARCMVNLSLPYINKRALDPFAGAGGIVFEYKYIVPDGLITSIDIDPVLKPGFEFYGSEHFVMNSNKVTFPENNFNSIITEVPFAEKAIKDIISFLKQIKTCVSEDGVFVIMSSKCQCLDIYRVMKELDNYFLFSHEIDRKGTDVVISIWWKNKNLLPGLDPECFISDLRKIY